MKTRFGHATAFGLASAIATIILALGLYLADLRNSALNYLSYPILITIMVIGVRKWREQNGGFLGFGPTYMHLFLQTLAFSVIITVWTMVFMSVIAPGLMEEEMLKQQVKMEEEGMSQAQIEMAMSYARKFSSPGVIAVFALIGNIIFMGLINLIVAAIVKKDPPPMVANPETSQDFHMFPPSSNTPPNTPPQA